MTVSEKIMNGRVSVAQRQVILVEGMVVEVARVIVDGRALGERLGRDDPATLAEFTQEAESEAGDLLHEGEKLHLVANPSEVTPLVIGSRFAQLTWMIL